jgi:hypothetical protein
MSAYDPKRTSAAVRLGVTNGTNPIQKYDISVESPPTLIGLEKCGGRTERVDGDLEDALVEEENGVFG